MTPDEHLDAIVRRCHALLALAEKRTPGEWKSGAEALFACVTGTSLDIHNVAENAGWDAAFIAACAGSAEAGWRATIAAIEGFAALASKPGMNKVAWDGLNAIRDAWPIETL